MSPIPSPESAALSPDLRARLAAIRLVVFDVDGTLTDGMIWAGDREMKVFHVQDGFGIKALQQAGIEVAWLTGRTSEVVARRASELAVRHLIQGREHKAEAMEALQRELGCAPEVTAAMGDDIPDLPLFRRAAVRLTVPEAAPEVLELADWVATRPAGRGAARQACELILKARGAWDDVVARFRQ